MHLLRVALLLVSLPFLVHGADGLRHAFRSRTKTQVTCDQFVRDPPRSGWLHLTGCEVDYVRAAYREQGGRIVELFFALRPSGSSPAQPAPLVLSTTEPAVLAIAERTLGATLTTDHESFLVMMLEIVTAMRAAREVDGVTRSPIEMLRTRGHLGAIKAPLADDFVILDLHESPRTAFAALETAGGALALLTAIFMGRGRHRTKEHADVAAETSTNPDSVAVAPSLATVHRPSSTPEPPTVSLQLRRLMLLNLPPDAGPGAVETAPALGQQEAVRSAISRVLPGVRFDDRGVAEVDHPDHYIRLDLGTAPDVWTAVVDVSGDEAPAALRRLVTQTGWRAYAPRLGRFITSEDLA